MPCLAQHQPPPRAQPSLGHGATPTGHGLPQACARPWRPAKRCALENYLPLGSSPSAHTPPSGALPSSAPSHSSAEPGQASMSGSKYVDSEVGRRALGLRPRPARLLRELLGVPGAGYLPAPSRPPAPPPRLFPYLALPRQALGEELETSLAGGGAGLFGLCLVIGASPPAGHLLALPLAERVSPPPGGPEAAATAEPSQAG